MSTLISLDIELNSIRSFLKTVIDAADLEYEIIIQNVNQLHNLMVKISNKIPNSIKNYRYHYTVLRHKGEEIIY